MDRAAGQEWCVHWHGRPVKSLKTAWKSALAKAGISRRIRPYDLRHAFATYALEAGADPGAVARIMGHSDTSMLRRNYQHVLDLQKQKVVQSVPALDVPKSLAEGHISGHERDIRGTFLLDFSCPLEKKYQ